MKTFKQLLTLAACAGRPAAVVTPAQRAQAAAVVLNGGTLDDVAAQMAMTDDQARRVLRTTIRELRRRLHESY